MPGDPPKYQVEDVLNKKKPPPQILDLKNSNVTGKDEFKKLMEKIPDYKIQPEKKEEVIQQLDMLETTMKSFRQKKKEIYFEQKKKNPVGPDMLKQPKLSTEENQSSHERAHTSTIPEKNTRPKSETAKRRPKSSGGVLTEARSATAQGMSRTLTGRSSTAASTERNGRGSISSNTSNNINNNNNGRSLNSTSMSNQSQTDNDSSRQKSTANGSGMMVEPDEYEFANPCPPSMTHVSIAELSSVNINWKMLTLARPTSLNDENIFSKLVELEKLRLATRKEEEKFISDAGVDPFVVIRNPSSSRGGVMEKFVTVCSECSEEFCSGTCVVFQYDSYQRLAKDAENNEPSMKVGADDDKDKKKKARAKSSKRRKNETAKKQDTVDIKDK